MWTDSYNLSIRFTLKDSTGYTVVQKSSFNVTVGFFFFCIFVLTFHPFDFYILLYFFCDPLLISTILFILTFSLAVWWNQENMKKILLKEPILPCMQCQSSILSPLAETHSTLGKTLNTYGTEEAGRFLTRNREMRMSLSVNKNKYINVSNRHCWGDSAVTCIGEISILLGDEAVYFH